VVKLHVHASEGRRERINHTSLYRAVETRSRSDAGEPLLQVVYNVEAGVAVFDTELEKMRKVCLGWNTKLKTSKASEKDSLQ